VRPPAHRRRAEAWLTRAGVAWQRERYARAGGETTAYRLMPSVSPRGRIVAAHGAGNDALYPLVGLFARLVAAGFEVFAFDGDGFGWDGTTRFDPSCAVSAVADAVGWAIDGSGDLGLPIHLLGHSLGGTMVLGALAGDPPPLVRSGILLSAPLSLKLGMRGALAEVLALAVPATIGEMRRFGAWGVLPAAGRFKRGAFPLRLSDERPGAFGYVGAVKELIRRIDPERAAADVKVPMLLVYGGRDGIVPRSQGELLARELGDARLVRLPRGTHWSVPLARRTHDEVVRWVEEHTPSDALEGPEVFDRRDVLGGRHGGDELDGRDGRAAAEAEAAR
jgi:pimeloyl-[acyl-carrier protein] methyl ester esterase